MSLYIKNKRRFKEFRHEIAAGETDIHVIIPLV